VFLHYISITPIQLNLNSDSVSWPNEKILQVDTKLSTVSHVVTPTTCIKQVHRMQQISITETEETVKQSLQ